MERFGMALPLSSSFLSKALASLLNGDSINKNIIGHLFIVFNMGGLILVLMLGSSTASVITESISLSWTAARTSGWRGRAGLPSASWQY